MKTMLNRDDSNSSSNRLSLNVLGNRNGNAHLLHAKSIGREISTPYVSSFNDEEITP